MRPKPVRRNAIQESVEEGEYDVRYQLGPLCHRAADYGRGSSRKGQLKYQIIPKWLLSFSLWLLLFDFSSK